MERIRFAVSALWSSYIQFFTHFISNCSMIAIAEWYFNSAASRSPLAYNALPSSRNTCMAFVFSSSLSCHESLWYSSGSSIEIISVDSNVKQTIHSLITFSRGTQKFREFVPMTKSMSLGLASSSSKSLYPMPSFCNVMPQQCLFSSDGFRISRRVFAMNGYWRHSCQRQKKTRIHWFVGFWFGCHQTHRFVYVKFCHFIQCHFLHNHFPHLEFEFFANNQLHGRTFISFRVIQQSAIVRRRSFPWLIMEFHLKSQTNAINNTILST